MEPELIIALCGWFLPFVPIVVGSAFVGLAHHEHEGLLSLLCWWIIIFLWLALCLLLAHAVKMRRFDPQNYEYYGPMKVTHQHYETKTRRSAPSDTPYEKNYVLTLHPTLTVEWECPDDEKTCTSTVMTCSTRACVSKWPKCDTSRGRREAKECVDQQLSGDSLLLNVYGDCDSCSAHLGAKDPAAIRTFGFVFLAVGSAALLLVIGKRMQSFCTNIPRRKNPAANAARSSHEPMEAAGETTQARNDAHTTGTRNDAETIEDAETSETHSDDSW